MKKQPTGELIVPPDVALVMRHERRLTPTGAQKQIDRLKDLGIGSRRDLLRTVELIAHFKTNSTAIIHWLEDGLSLTRIERCLQLQRETNFCTGDSVAVINWFVEELNSPDLIGDDDNIADFLQFFRDTFEGIGSRFSAQRLRHFIENHCPNGVHEAYQIAQLDPEGFVRTVMSSHGWRNEGRPMPDLSSIYDQTIDGYEVPEIVDLEKLIG